VNFTRNYYLQISSNVLAQGVIVFRFASRCWSAQRVGLGFRHDFTRVLAYFYRTALRDMCLSILWLIDWFFLSVSFSFEMWDTDRLGGLLPNADSGVPCPQFGCKLRISRLKFLVCIFVMINLILNFSMFELGFSLFVSRRGFIMRCRCVRCHRARSAVSALCWSRSPSSCYLLSLCLKLYY